MGLPLSVSRLEPVIPVSFAFLRSRLSLPLFALLLLVCLLSPSSPLAQVIEAKGGSSSLFGASGATVSFETARYAASASLGWHDGPLAGFYLAAPLGNGLLGLGDQTIPLVVPTDIFNSGFYFLGRGASYRISSARGSLFLFSGASSSRLGTPFFAAATPVRFAAALFYTRPLSETWSYSLSFAQSGPFVLLHSLDWKPAPSLSLAATAGNSGSDPYAAASFDWHRPEAELKASYAQMPATFQRLAAPAPLSAEYDRENIVLQLKPARIFAVTLSRENFLVPLATGSGGQRALMDGASFSLSPAFLRFHATLFRSETVARTSDGLTLGLERKLFPRVTAAADYFVSAPMRAPRSTSSSATIRERFTSRLNLNQSLQISSGQKTLGIGGSFEGNSLSVGVDYQTIFLPFAVPGQPAFRQVALLHLRWLLPRGLELHADTNVTPLGRVRYTAYADSVSYLDSAGSTRPSSRRKFAPCAVLGGVYDESGSAVSGAAVAVDGQLVFSDSDGQFLAPMPRCISYPFRVVHQEFLTLETYTVVAAPSFVVAAPESTAAPVRVLLRRTPTPAPPAEQPAREGSKQN